MSQKVTQNFFFIHKYFNLPHKTKIKNKFLGLDFKCYLV